MSLNNLKPAKGSNKTSGKRLGNVEEDEETKQLSSKIEESTAGVGAGESSDAGSQSGGTQGITGAKSDINEKNVKLNDKKEEEVEEELVAAASTRLSWQVAGMKHQRQRRKAFLEKHSILRIKRGPSFVALNYW